ncbi:unnamed protein product, partial [Ixodes pacificus]
GAGRGDAPGQAVAGDGRVAGRSRIQVRAEAGAARHAQGSRLPDARRRPAGPQDPDAARRVHARSVVLTGRRSTGHAEVGVLVKLDADSRGGGGHSAAAGAAQRHGDHSVDVGQEDGHANACGQVGQLANPKRSHHSAGNNEVALETTRGTQVILGPEKGGAHLAADPNRDADDDGGHRDARDEGNSHGGPHEHAQLPEDLLLAAPGLLAPEGATRGTGEGRGTVRNLLHAEPAELCATQAARHVVAGAVVHLDDEHLAAGAVLDVV